MTKKNVTMTIDNDVLQDFKVFCKNNGMKLSTRVEMLMHECAAQARKKKESGSKL